MTGWIPYELSIRSLSSTKAQPRSELAVSEVKQTISRAKLLVNPSRMEGFSVALIEALACGTPVLGWADQVRELGAYWRRPVGFPFDARNQSAEELEALIQRALDDPILDDPSRNDLSLLARESFSMDRYGREMARQYVEVLDGM